MAKKTPAPAKAKRTPPKAVGGRGKQRKKIAK